MPHYGRITLRPWRRRPLCFPGCAHPRRPAPRQPWRDRHEVSGASSRIQCRHFGASTTLLASSVDGSASIAPVTAVNAPLSVPEHLRPLYQALDRLNTHAGTYVNISRLQLALAGLKSETPGLRVAIFGTSGTDSPRKLAKLLLADILKDEEGWEKQLVEDHSGNAVVIRYGEESDIVSARSPIPTILSTSRVLKDHRLELLVSNIDILRPSISDTPTDAIVVPSVETRTSTTGRTTLITVPVHKALVVLENLDDMLKYARYVLGQDTRDLGPEVVKLVVPSKDRGIQTNAEADSAIALVDADLASSGLNLMRESVANASEATQQLNASNLTGLADWLTHEDPSAPLHPTIRALITSVLSDTARTIDAAPALLSADPLIDPATLRSLDQAVAAWSTAAHAHHQSTLPQLTTLPLARLSSPALLLLPLRIDDVRWTLEDAVSRHYLIRPEKELIYLTGQLTRLGVLPSAPILSDDQLAAAARAIAWPDADADAPPPLPLDVAPEATEAAISASATQSATLAAPPPPRLRPAAAADPTAAPTPDPLATNPINLIPLSRTHLRALLPAQHRRAQALLATFLTTSAASALLGALSYVSIAGMRVTDGIVVGALGVVFAARRFVKGWEGWAREWEGQVKEEGRRCVSAVEEVVRGAVEGKMKEERGETVDWEKERAREAVEAVRRELDRLEAGGKR